MKTLGRLWQYCGDESSIDNNNNITDFFANNNNRNSFKFNQQIKGQTENGRTKDFEIMFSLKCLNNFWKTLEMSLTNCEITFPLTCFQNRIRAAGTAANEVQDKKKSMIHQ